jgi:hypothetical protein
MHAQRLYKKRSARVLHMYAKYARRHIQYHTPPHLALSEARQQFLEVIHAEEEHTAHAMSQECSLPKELLRR